jgi:hypothetical protein
MLLKRKSKDLVDSDWAIILERIENEFAKGRAVDQLAQLFSLSPQEAKDLIDNTPIILLDHLALDTAEKIKNYFSESNMNCSLTNDVFAKRKCFRAVWPEQPDLLRFAAPSAPPSVPQLEETIAPVKESSIYEVPLTFGALSQEEEKQLKEIVSDLQKENEVLKHQLAQAHRAPEEVRPRLIEKEVEHLRSERLGLEGTVGKLRAENSILKSKVEELEKSLKSLKQEHETEAVGRTTELKAQLEHLKAEYNKTLLAARRAQSEAQQFHL